MIEEIGSVGGFFGKEVHRRRDAETPKVGPDEAQRKPETGDSEQVVLETRLLNLAKRVLRHMHQRQPDIGAVMKRVNKEYWNEPEVIRRTAEKIVERGL